MPDPKLKTAAAEILVVLKKHDIGALVILSSQSHMEHLTHLTPSWSCVVEEDYQGQTFVRLKSKLENYPSKEVRLKVLEDSLGMMLGFRDVTAHRLEDLDRLVAQLAHQGMNIEHWSRQEEA